MNPHTIIRRLLQCSLFLSFFGASAQSDTTRIRAAIEEAASLLTQNDPAKALQRLEAIRPSLPPATGQSLRSAYHWQMGEILYKQKAYTAFDRQADTVLLLNPAGSGDQRWRAKGLYQKAFANIHLGNLDQSIAFVKEGIAIYQSLKDAYGEAKGYQAIGNISFQGRQVKEAIQQYQRAIAVFLDNKYPVDAAMTSCSISRAYIADMHIDSAFAWNDRAMAVAASNPDNLELNFFVWQNDGDYKSRMGRFDAADISFQKARQFAARMSSGYSLGGLLQVMSFSAFNSGNMKKAVDYAEESKRIFEQMGDYPMLKKTFQLLYTIHEGKGDYKSAFDALNEYVDISDSLFTQNSMQQINDLNVKYETAQKESKIAQQQLDLERKNARMSRLLFGLGLALLLIGLLLLLYFQRKKTYQQSLITLKKEQDISLLKALMTGEEKERNRLARELHDGLGSVLAAAQMQVSHLKIIDDEQQKNARQQATELINQASAESRRIAHNLLPEILLRFGLDEALKEYSRSISDSRLIKLDYESVGMNKPLEQSVELSIYRIIQELVNNIVKHAGATEALVQLHRHQDMLSITVEDNGHGFAPDKDTEKGIGLHNIRSRISYLNGSLDIRSTQQKGTSVYIEIKLQKNDSTT